MHNNLKAKVNITKLVELVEDELDVIIGGGAGYRGKNWHYSKPIRSQPQNCRAILESHC